MANVLRTGAGDATQGEEYTLSLLETLPKDWTVIANKILAINPTNSFEIDFIVISPHRIMILDEKSYWGTITGTDEVWTLGGGSSIRSPFGKIDMVARRLAGLLDKKVGGFPAKQSGVVPVIGGILLSNESVSAQIGDLRANRCLLTRSNTIAKLLWLDQEAKEVGFDFSPIRVQISNTLYNDNSAHKPKKPSQVGLYEIEDEIDERADCRVFLARNEAGESRHLYMYPHNPGTKSVRETLDRELISLSLLQSTKIVPDVGEPFLWSEDEFLVVPVHLPEGMAVAARPAVSSKDMAVREIEAAAAAFDAISHLHEKGIIHRALRPEVVYIYDPTPPSADAQVAHLPQATITGFVAAHIDHTATIFAALDETGFEDTYSAPEITTMRSYSYADQSSDVYSMALVTLERLINRPASSLDSETIPTLLQEVNVDLWPFLTESSIVQLRSAYGRALTTGTLNNEPRISASDMAFTLGQIAKEIRKEAGWESGKIPGTDYEMIRILGEGTSARTYLLYNQINDIFVAGKHFFRSDTLEEPIREAKILWQYPHNGLPKLVEMPSTTKPDFPIVLEYIEGETLRNLIHGFQNDRDTWTNLMHDLLSAVEHLEHHGLLHRDIKPDNVMIRETDGRAILIDYGASATAIDPGPMSGSPKYWPPEWKQGTTHPITTDRYAVAVTLFEALTGESPFKAVGASFHGDLVVSLPDSLPLTLRPAALQLLRALSLDPLQRFSSTSDLRNALDQALEGPMVLPDPEEPSDPDQIAETIEWINNVRGLFRNSARGNADNRGLETTFARATYVRTSLDDSVGPAVAIERPAAVFLSGNPGDGKTAFLEQMRTALEQAGALMVESESDLSGWEAMLRSQTFRACFDASESANGRSADEQLAHRLRGLEGESPNAEVTVLVAINDGRLAEIQYNLAEDFPWLVNELKRVGTLGWKADVAKDLVWLIDLKQRSYVSLKPDSAKNSVMRNMLNTLIAPSHWTAQPSDGFRSLAIENSTALRNQEPNSASARLERLLALAHLRGERHMTVRDLRSALSYLITFDLEPETDAVPARPWTGKYWNTLFTTNTSTDLVLGEMEWLDPARFAHPALVLQRHLIGWCPTAVVGASGLGLPLAAPVRPG